MPGSVTPNLRYICFVALREEMAYVDAALMQQPSVKRARTTSFNSKRSRHYYYLSSPTTGIRIEVEFVVNTEMGNLGTTGLVLHELSIRSYQAAFILGIAGTMQPTVCRLGDVVVAHGAKYLGFDRVKLGSSPVVPSDDRKTLASGSWLRVRRDVVERERTEIRLANYVDLRANVPLPGLRPVGAQLLPPVYHGYANSSPGISQGLVFGSDWVVDSPDFLEFLLERNDRFDLDAYNVEGKPADMARTRWQDHPEPALCLDMETYGFFKALDISGKGLFHGYAIRGISDPCADKKKVEAFSGGRLRDIASFNAALVLVDLLLNIVAADVGGVV